MASELLMQRTKTAHGPGSMNPASVTNPMSANPLSNYANPSSVKSTTDLEPKSVDNPSPEKAVASSKPPTSLQDQFQSAFDSFFAVCDKVEKQFVRFCSRFCDVLEIRSKIKKFLSRIKSIFENYE